MNDFALSVYDYGDIKVLFGSLNNVRGGLVLGVSCSASLLRQARGPHMTPKNSLTTALLIAALALPVSAFAQTTTAPSPSMPPAAAAPRAAAPAATAPQAAAPAAASHTLPAAAQASRHMRDDQIRASKPIGAP